jgi:hypothetical protein
MAFLRLEYLSNARLIYLLLNFIKIYVEIIEKVRPKSLVGGLYIFLLYVTEFDGQTLIVLPELQRFYGRVPLYKR